MNKEELFICECHCRSHQVIFQYDEDENELICHVHLNGYFGVFKRIFYAIKYICGYRTDYGHWDCVIFKKEDIPRLEGLIKEIKDDETRRLESTH